jgi:hypothetical protein
MSEIESLRSALRAGPDCLPVEMLHDRLPLSPEDQLHVSQCAYCQTQIALLNEFEAGVVRPDEAEAVRWITAQLAKPAVVQPAIARRWWSPRILLGFGSVAALIVVAVGLGSYRDKPNWDFGGDNTRSGTIEVVPAPSAFEWKPVQGAADYELTARLVDGSVVFHNVFTKRSLAYPPEVAKTVSIGKLVLWEVVARDAAGKEIARSGVQRLHQAPAQ